MAFLTLGSKDGAFSMMKIVESESSENICCKMHRTTTCSRSFLPTSLLFCKDSALELFFDFSLSSHIFFFYFRIWLGWILCVLFKMCVTVNLKFRSLWEMAEIWSFLLNCMAARPTFILLHDYVASRVSNCGWSKFAITDIQYSLNYYFAKSISNCYLNPFD